MPSAGSAIAQNVGKLSNFDSWRPNGSVETKWLLLAGANDPPCKTSDRRSRDADKGGSFLDGVDNDLVTMKSSPVVKQGLRNILRDFDLEKEEVRKKIKKFFFFCKQHESQPVLYYTGHGQVGLKVMCIKSRYNVSFTGWDRQLVLPRRHPQYSTA